jgi:hypothetical protein
MKIERERETERERERQRERESVQDLGMLGNCLRRALRADAVQATVVGVP